MKKIKLALATLACALMLSGCATTVTLDAAENANDPACAEVIVRLPDVIDVLPKRSTNAQATGAWGEPTAVILRCGLPDVAASSLTCVTAGGVDWLVDDSQSPSFRFITFGRNPATEVIVDSTAISGVSALEALAPAVENIASTKNCK
ncbi:MAG: hypothetical protein RLY13_126 [Actinomycetota bacterium]|jgi:hypothetical protein